MAVLRKNVSTVAPADMLLSNMWSNLAICPVLAKAFYVPHIISYLFFLKKKQKALGSPCGAINVYSCRQ